MQEQKYIALIDCDNFFVSCERLLNPELQDKPVCVVSGDRGCIISRSKEAKMLGVKMGEPLFMAKERIPNCIYVNANHYEYCKISEKIMNILKNLSPYFEAYSIDEAFIDLTGLAKYYKMNYYKLGLFIKEKIKDEVGIPVSIGISRSKTLAKLTGDKAKNSESHVCMAGKSSLSKLLKTSDISEVWGIGNKLAPKLKGHGIYTAYDYVQKNDIWLKSRLGKNGLEIKYELLGNLINKVSTEIKPPKSISDTRSFSDFSSDYIFLKNEMMKHIHNVCRKLRKCGCKCKTIGVILKTKDFRTFYSKTELKDYTDFEFEISKYAFKEMDTIYNSKTVYRSTGIVLENFCPNKTIQLDIFADENKTNKQENLGKALDKLEKKFGNNVVKTGFTNENSFKQDFLIKRGFENTE